MVVSGHQTQAGEDRFKDYKDFAEQDAAFHRIIAEHSGNALLTDAIERLRSHLHQYRIYFRHGVVGETSGEHEAVLAALRAGDAAAAERAMLAHLTSSYHRISSSLEEKAD
jgi:DNA-binding GntR family transcriptional regulator